MKEIFSLDSLGALVFSLLVVGVCYASPQYSTAVDAVGTIQADAYRQLGASVVPVASMFVAGVHAFGDRQLYVYESVIDTFNTSSNTMGAAVADSIRQAPLLATPAAEWLIEANNRAAERLQQ